MAGNHASFGLPQRRPPEVFDAAEAVACLKEGRAEPTSLLAYGNGRSYGDTCLNGRGAVVDMRSMNRIVAFDPTTGIVTAQAGVMLSDLIDHVGPHGWFPAAVPGTRFVTLGGAVANDIHGKNHHKRGTFGCHVKSLTLLRSDGIVHECCESANQALFRATIAGMGLTGLILTATLKLMRVGSADVMETVTPFDGLADYFDRADDADRQNEYAVAWIDQLASGRHAGRGLLLTANHVADDEAFVPAGQARLSVPFQMPVSLLNRPSLTLFNALYRSRRKGTSGARRASYASYFFPLDGVRHWNRLYGPRGLYQHQSVIPFDAARAAVPMLLAAARDAGEASFLTVLKRFGGVRSPGILSFPRAGYTLTLDFPNRGESTRRLLERLDAITMDAGGAVNPYKDARMSAEVFAASFPGWRSLEQARDRAFMSDFWRRTAGRLSIDPDFGDAPPDEHLQHAAGRGGAQKAMP